MGPVVLSLSESLFDLGSQNVKEVFKLYSYHLETRTLQIAQHFLQTPRQLLPFESFRLQLDGSSSLETESPLKNCFVEVSLDCFEMAESQVKDEWV